VRVNGSLVESTWEEAFGAIVAQLHKAGNSVGAIAGPMMSNEDLWELRRLVEGSGSNQLGVWPYHMTGADSDG